MSHSNTPPVRNRAPLTARSSSLRCVSAAKHPKTGRTKPQKHLPRSALSWNTRQDFLNILRNDAVAYATPIHAKINQRLEVFSRWLSTQGLRFNQWPSWWYSLYMLNCFRCVQLIEADPLNLTKYFVSLPDLHHYDISPAPCPTRPQAANFITSGATKINISIHGSCDIAAVYCSSISWQKQAS